MAAVSQQLSDIISMLDNSSVSGSLFKAIDEAISALWHARAEAEEMEERLAMLEMHDEDQVAQLGVPGKRGNREIRMGADSILARGQSLSFSRVLYARFPNPMMLARVEMGKDHCIFLLAEEAMFDRDREANA